ncbi:hypothetical protein [Dactylosporangium fulvum]|uniref:Uncharacterized protein n=1 Tax=Dactylosporangium fulvum TaxID=53359 RepID=A0ABY5VR46_9ACTN|nr:hypothetical protein [Dactylosporangium fulvum]UWP80005.1 hypothetical protein Dfulv_33225 [Dactylosporangium fulvum]
MTHPKDHEHVERTGVVHPGEVDAAGYLVAEGDDAGLRSVA